MKKLIILALLASTPAWAAEPITTNGYVTLLGNTINQRIDQFQAASPSLPANLQTMINTVQTGTITPAINSIKAMNPTPNLVSPFQTFTIGPFPPLH